MLNGSDPYLPAFLIIDRATRAKLLEAGSRPVLLFSEAIDAQRFPIETLEAEYLALLAKKYGATRIDVVVAFSRPALDFFARHGARLWPGARLVYQGFVNDRVGLPALPANVTGVMAPEDVRGTIDLATRLQPLARRMFIITGVADLDKRYERLARAALSSDKLPFTVEYLTGLPQAELLARVGGLEPDAIVIYLTHFRDREGRAYPSADLLSRISKASTAPVYTISEALVGVGTVGGVMESLEDRGRLVAEQVLAAVSGQAQDPSRVLLQSPSRCIADWRALRRWSLDEDLLPSGCDVRFAQRSFWREYFWAGFAGLLVIAVQAATIVALVGQMRRRRLAEAEARKRFSEMAHMNRRISLGEVSASIAHELNQPLGAILNNAAAAELYLAANPPRLREVTEILHDIKRDDQRASDIISRVRKMLVRADFEVRSIDLNAAIAGTISLLAEEAATRGVALESQVEPQLRLVSADPTEVEQVIVNLALNAMEAMTEAPGAERRLVIRSRSINRKHAEVSVSDTGPGIRPEMLPRVFDPFVSSKGTGMGLGLAISRTIIEVHGGKMRAENQAQGGAVITFTLPFAAEPADA